MPSRSNLRHLAGCGALGIGASGALLIIVLTLGAPAWVSSRLGPPDASLSWTDRTLLALHLASRMPDLRRPAGASEAAIELEVSAGSSASDVIDRLHAAAIVEDPSLLRSYLRYSGLDRGIQAGAYDLRGTMTPVEIADALQSARPPEIVFTVLEGWRREQIAQAAGAAGFAFDSAAFLLETERSAPELQPEFEGSSNLEGFLFPDTYRLQPEASAHDVVAALVRNFQARVDADLRGRLVSSGLSLLQAVTLASIVEREAVLPAERPLIAAVFLRRLADGIRLEADPTVQFALGLQENGDWWKSPLSLADLEMDSPYNTYRYGGLPPAPISSPGLDSLLAVANPAATDYLFFRAACDGSGRHLFSRTFEEHLAQACQ